MRIERSDPKAAKGWYTGPWDSGLPVSIGYANEGINEPHLHTRITEIYLVARGTSTVRVESETITLQAGDVLVIEPGEAHTFLSSSPGCMLNPSVCSWQRDPLFPSQFRKKGAIVGAGPRACPLSLPGCGW